jgi:hypothetical protein
MISPPDRASGVRPARPRVAELGDDDRYPHEALRHLDTELARNLDRLKRIRAQLGEVLARGAPMDLPTGMAAAIGAEDLSDTDRSLLVVLSRVLDADLVMNLVGALRAVPGDGAARALEELEAGADETTRQHVAERLLPRAAAVLALLLDRPDAVTGAAALAAARRTVDQAVDDLYNPAQVDVLRRVRRMRDTPPRRTPTPRTGAFEPRAPRRTNPTPVGASR